MAKAAFWALPDAEERKLGEQTGLERYLVLFGSNPADKTGCIGEHPTPLTRKDNAEGSREPSLLHRSAFVHSTATKNEP